MWASPDCTSHSLSIHDLTRRSTKERGRMSEIKFFQFTTSQGGRLYYFQADGISILLSIHDLTRRSTEYCYNIVCGWTLSIHDLTRRST